VGKVIFVTYASGVYEKNMFWNKLFIKIFIRPDKIIFFTDKDLKKSNIYEQNKNIFDSTIGAGYWAWKPWAILEAVKSANEGDIILYQDCGKGFKYKNFLKPTNLINYAKTHNIMPGILVPIHGKNKNWTHSKCFELMNCNNERYYNTPQVEAVISAWKVNPKSIEVLSEWLKYCLNIEIIGDCQEKSLIKNNEFRNHRYDQSILTNLVIKKDLKPIRLSFDDMHFSKSMSLVDLDLDKKNFFNKMIRNIILLIFRLKNNFKYILNRRNK